VCGTNKVETLTLKTNTQYRIETNAQAYSSNAGGALVDYRSELSFRLP
jgi:hypothetical protein